MSHINHYADNLVSSYENSKLDKSKILCALLESAQQTTSRKEARSLIKEVEKLKLKLR